MVIHTDLLGCIYVYFISTWYSISLWTQTLLGSKKKEERFVVGKTVLLKLGINELTTYEFWAAFSLRNTQTRQISNRTFHADNRASAAPTFFKDDKTE